MKTQSSIKLSFVFSGLLAILSFMLWQLYPTSSFVSAQTPCVTASPAARYDGLLSTPELTTTSKFGSVGGNCVIGTTNPLHQATLPTHRLTTYDELKNKFYNNANPTYTAKQTLNGDQTNINLSGTNNQIRLVQDGNLTITADPTGTNTAIVFVDRNLYINSNILYGSPNNRGLVFVVKGSIIIDRSVNRIDALLIAQGEDTVPNYSYAICTTTTTPGSGICDQTATPLTTDQQLVVNGSLINLSGSDQSSNAADKQIAFKRNLELTAGGNSVPAEKINNQAKYLVILKDIFAEPFTIQYQL